MRARWVRFVRFLSAQEDATPLALVRILCASTVALHLGRFLATGAAEVVLVHHDDGGLSASRGWLEHIGGATPANVQALCAVVVVAALFAAVGLLTRPSLVVVWLGLRAIGTLNTSAHGSYDALLVDTLFILMLSDCARALSLDARWRGLGGTAARWPRLLLIVQLVLLYLGSGLSKASSSWIPGGDASALWYILHQPMWARFPELPLWAYPVTQLATTVTWIFEITAPLFLFASLLETSAPQPRWLQRMRTALGRIRYVEVYLVIGALMHVGVELTMDVGPFSFASLALYPAALGPARLRFYGRRSPRAQHGSPATR